MPPDGGTLLQLGEPKRHLGPVDRHLLIPYFPIPSILETRQTNRLAHILINRLGWLYYFSLLILLYIFPPHMATVYSLSLHLLDDQPSRLM